MKMEIVKTDAAFGLALLLAVIVELLSVQTVLRLVPAANYDWGIQKQFAAGANSNDHGWCQEREQRVGVSR